MVAKSEDYDQLSGPRTHIDVLIDRFPTPNLLDMEEANKIKNASKLVLAYEKQHGITASEPIRRKTKRGR